MFGSSPGRNGGLRFFSRPVNVPRRLHSASRTYLRGACVTLSVAAMVVSGRGGSQSEDKRRVLAIRRHLDSFDCRNLFLLELALFTRSRSLPGHDVALTFSIRDARGAKGLKTENLPSLDCIVRSAKIEGAFRRPLSLTPDQERTHAHVLKPDTDRCHTQKRTALHSN